MKKLLLMLLLSGISIQDLKASDREDHDGSSSESADDKMVRPARRRRGTDGAAPVPDQRAAGAAESAAEGGDWESLNAAIRDRRGAAAPEPETSRGIKRKAEAEVAAETATTGVKCDRCEKDEFASEQEVLSHQEGYGRFGCPDAPCSVCLEPLGDLAEVTFKGCGHAFHTNCAKNLQQNSFGCVLCRGSKLPIQQLLAAAGSGNVAAVTTLLGAIPQNEQADFVRMPNQLGLTALHVAAQRGHHNVVDALLAVIPENEHVAYIRMPTAQRGFTALHLAASAGHNGVITRLLDTVPPDQRAQLVGLVSSQNHNNTLHLAVLNGAGAAIHTLLNAVPAAERAAFVQIVNGAGLTALQLAVNGRNASVIVALLDKEPTLLQQNDQLIRELLLVPGLLPQVIASGNAQLVAAWLAKISDTGNEAVIRQFTSYGSILHMAAKQGNTEIFAMALAAISEADRHFFAVWAPPTGVTALHYAAEQGNAEIVAMLLAAVPEADRPVFVQRRNSENKTALHLAFKKENDQALARLLAEIPTIAITAFMYEPNEEAGKTPLHLAVEKNNAPLVATLLAALAAIPETAKLDFLQRKEEDGGGAAMHQAAERGNAEIVTMLLNAVHGDDRIRLVLDVSDGTHWTTLHCAAYGGNLAVVTMILAEIPAIDRAQFVQYGIADYGKTALHFAAKAGNVEMVTRLLAEVPESEKQNFVRALCCDDLDEPDKTALQIAQQGGHADVVALLQPYMPMLPAE